MLMNGKPLQGDEAAERHRLPIGVHAGSTYRHATTANGWPSYHLEDVVVRSQAFQGQLLNLVHEGVFAKFPDLRFVMIERLQNFGAECCGV